MPSLELILAVGLFAAGLVNAALGLVIGMGGVKTASHRFFLGFVASVSVWCFGLGAFLLSDDAIVALDIARLYYVAASLIAFTLLAFTLTYAKSVSASTRVLLALLAVPTLYMVILAIVPNNASFVVRAELGSTTSGLNEVILRPMPYQVYAFYFLAYMYTGIAWIGIQLLRLRRTPRAGSEFNRLMYVFGALLLAGTFGAFFNLVLPLLGNYDLIWIGPLFSVLMVFLIFYSIFKHGLFSVRLAVARTSAYALLLMTLVGIYSIAIFSVSSLLFDSSTINVASKLVDIVLAVFLAFTFMPLKKFFDRVTNNIFFKDDYQPQTVLDALGDIIATETSLRSLMRRSVGVVGAALGPTFTQATIIAHDGELHSFSEGRNPAKKIVAADYAELLSDYEHQSVIRLQQLEEEEPLAVAMRRSEVAAIVRLELSGKSLGFVALGERQNGSGYAAKDVDMLGVIADELSLAVQNSLRYTQIASFNRTLEDKVEEATLALRKSNAKLKDLDSAKDEFISMASHQLRTPLTSVKGYISMVLDGDAGDITPTQRKFLEEAYASSQRMVYLIADLLNVSRLQTGKFIIEHNTVNLADVVEQEVSQLVGTAKARQLTLEYAKPSNFPLLTVDDTKLRQVVMNFIDNAIYYSKAGTTITVSLGVLGGQAVLKVRDQGIGVPAKERQHLFQKFFRAGNARSARPDGTGIGLFMAKKVVVAHGGAIIFESQEGKGSTFGFSLPLADHTAAPTAQPAVSSADTPAVEAVQPA